MAEDGPAIRSLTGATRQGAPLALSRAPAADLRPWVYWLSVAEGQLPEGHTVHCGILGDHTCIRVLFGGTWTAETTEGRKVFDPGEHGIALFFGPQTRRMPIAVTGSYRAVTLHLMAGGSVAMGGPAPSDMLDRVVDYDAMVGHGRLAGRIPAEQDYGAWLDAFEAELRTFVRLRRPDTPDPLVAAFERECLAAPDFAIAAFGASHGVSRRGLERRIKRGFGLTPKQVLRRARALDMAASLLGVAMPDEQPGMHLRYFDQSHLNREIRGFFGMTPGELERGYHPMLRLNMESRQNRRLRTLEAIAADEPRPWRDPGREPDGGLASPSVE